MADPKDDSLSVREHLRAAGRKGGLALMKRLSKKKRTALARRAALARWGKR